MSRLWLHRTGYRSLETYFCFLDFWGYFGLFGFFWCYYGVIWGFWDFGGVVCWYGGFWVWFWSVLGQFWGSENGLILGILGWG